jgi:hypothetical protein
MRGSAANDPWLVRVPTRRKFKAQQVRYGVPLVRPGTESLIPQKQIHRILNSLRSCIYILNTVFSHIASSFRVHKAALSQSVSAKNKRDKKESQKSSGNSRWFIVKVIVTVQMSVKVTVKVIVTVKMCVKVRDNAWKCVRNGVKISENAWKFKWNSQWKSVRLTVKMGDGWSCICLQPNHDFEAFTFRRGIHWQHHALSSLEALINLLNKLGLLVKWIPSSSLASGQSLEIPFIYPINCTDVVCASSIS